MSSTLLAIYRQDGVTNTTLTTRGYEKNTGTPKTWQLTIKNCISSCYMRCEPVYLTLAPAGGGGDFNPPLRFFADSEKTAARSAAKFAIAVQPTI